MVKMCTVFYTVILMLKICPRVLVYSHYYKVAYKVKKGEKVTKQYNCFSS